MEELKKLGDALIKRHAEETETARSLAMGGEPFKAAAALARTVAYGEVMRMIDRALKEAESSPSSKAQ
jgi:2-keto-4-pentenoate hydratase